ncbi:MAG: phage tail protein [Pseudomonadota bacterium]
MALGFLGTAQPAQAQEKYISEIIMVGTNFCPRGTMPANGQLLQVSEHTALFSLLGTMYGGDGRTTFALPDLRDRTPVHATERPGVVKDAPPPPPPAPVAPMPPVMESDAPSPEVEPAPQHSAGTLSVNYCVVIYGLFPSRN